MRRRWRINRDAAGASVSAASCESGDGAAAARAGCRSVASGARCDSATAYLSLVEPSLLHWRRSRRRACDCVLTTCGDSLLVGEASLWYQRRSRSSVRYRDGREAADASGSGAGATRAASSRDLGNRRRSRTVRGRDGRLSVVAGDDALVVGAASRRGTLRPRAGSALAPWRNLVVCLPPSAPQIAGRMRRCSRAMVVNPPIKLTGSVKSRKGSLSSSLEAFPGVSSTAESSCAVDSALRTELLSCRRVRPRLDERKDSDQSAAVFVSIV